MPDEAAVTIAVVFLFGGQCMTERR